MGKQAAADLMQAALPGIGDLLLPDTPPLMRKLGFLSVADLAVELGMGRPATYKLVRTLKPKITRAGKKLFVDYESLKAAIVKGGIGRKPRRKVRATGGRKKKS